MKRKPPKKKDLPKIPPANSSAKLSQIYGAFHMWGRRALRPSCSLANNPKRMSCSAEGRIESEAISSLRNPAEFGMGMKEAAAFVAFQAQSWSY